MTAPHLPPDLPWPPTLEAVVPLHVDLGAVGGHRLLLLALEVWDGWADLRFARVDVGADRPLKRRVPPVEAWSVAADGAALDLLDAVGRGDRAFSNGEVRIRPVPAPGSTLEIAVSVMPDAPALTGRVRLPTTFPAGQADSR